MYELIGVVALAVFFAFWHYWWKKRRLRVAANWPVADGHVAQVEEKRDDNGFLVVTL
jgi:hypothetical protein